jgi:hypothetical protein
MKRMTCEVCGSHDFRKADDDLFVCEFCQTKYTPEQAKKLLVEGVVKIDKSDDAKKYLAMAEHSLESDNVEEAYFYANKILEVNHEDSQGWLLKGVAAGSLSTLKSPRINEMLKAFQLSLKHSNEDTRKGLRGKLVENSMRLSEGLACVIIETVREMSRCADPYNVYSWDGELWRLCLLAQEESKAGLSFVVENAEGKEQKIQALDGIVVLGNEMLEGLSNMPDERGPIGASMNQERKSLREYLESQKNEALEAAKKIDPEVKIQDGSSCFIATATMGSGHSKPVIILRHFRDQILTESRNGRAFVKWYYTYGPYLASIVRKSATARGLSLLFVVMPATLIAWICLTAVETIESFKNKQTIR